MNQLELGVNVDSFESEVDSTLREPGWPMTIYVEEESHFNRAYLSWLQASRSGVVLPKNDLQQTPDTPRELFETEGFHEQKINYFGKLLVEIEETLSGIRRSIYQAIIIVVVGYLIYKALAWFFHWA